MAPLLGFAVLDYEYRYCSTSLLFTGVETMWREALLMVIVDRIVPAATDGSACLLLSATA